MGDAVISHASHQQAAVWLPLPLICGHQPSGGLT